MFCSPTIENNGFMQLFILVIVLTISACGGGVVGDSSNYLIVKDQELINLDEVLIESASLDQNAIIVLYSESPTLENTKSDTVLAFKALNAGQYENIVIRLDSDASNNQTIFAELWADNGNIGELELDGTDSLISQSATSSVSFGVSYSVEPYLEAFLNDENQYVTSNVEEIVLRKVITADTSWIVVYRDIDGELGDEMGYQLLNPGHHSKVIIRIKPNERLLDGESISVRMYKDVDNLTSRFDSSIDELVVGIHAQQSFDVLIQLGE